ncbi:MAG: type II toxin-antitoxin system VapC family toxin [Pseudomonadota bacterium]|nr:type II toxin-antitoxin system VapC family toxin [Pseudomonadota bacterium]
MLRFLLDTDICSYAIKRKSPALYERLKAAMLADAACISAITRGELIYGLERVPQATALRAAVLAFLDEIPCLPWTPAAADFYGGLRARQRLAGQPIGYMDTQIAAHALAENLILVSNNLRHYERIPGLKLENWTES